MSWTHELNARRCDLIDKEIDGSITLEECVELENLQQAMLAYRHSVAPLPLAELRAVLEELNDRARVRDDK